MFSACFIDEMQFYKDEMQKKLEKSCFFRLIEICLRTQNLRTLI